ncbi:hypothetical protein ACWE42_18595 [Sutcliffiella cohnii]|nr:hypothetical protein [Sutcliffiella cohnii]
MEKNYSILDGKIMLLFLLPFPSFNNEGETKMKKGIILTSILLLVAIIFICAIPFTVTPPEDTRVILEHNHETYIAPSCFQQAEITNYIEDSNLKKAKELGYVEESSCTETALEPVKKPIVWNVLVKLNLIESPWN